MLFLICADPDHSYTMLWSNETKQWECPHCGTAVSGEESKEIKFGGKTKNGISTVEIVPCDTMQEFVDKSIAYLDPVHD